jgi:hypothetical protein
MFDLFRRRPHRFAFAHGTDVSLTTNDCRLLTGRIPCCAERVEVRVLELGDGKHEFR